MSHLIRILSMPAQVSGARFKQAFLSIRQRAYPSSEPDGSACIRMADNLHRLKKTWLKSAFGCGIVSFAGATLGAVTWALRQSFLEIFYPVRAFSPSADTSLFSLLAILFLLIAGVVFFTYIFFSAFLDTVSSLRESSRATGRAFHQWLSLRIQFFPSTLFLHKLWSRHWQKIWNTHPADALGILVSLPNTYLPLSKAQLHTLLLSRDKEIRVQAIRILAQPSRS